MVVSKTSMKIAGPRSMGWNSGIKLLIDRVKIHVDHPLAAVVGVANQPLSPGINHEIEQFQGNHIDENRAIISELRDFDYALAILDGQPRRAATCWDANRSPYGGMTRSSSKPAVRRTTKLSSALPGTITGPLSPPWKAAGWRSSRSPPFCLLGPWQA